MNIEELKTDRDLCQEQNKSLSDKLKQTRADLERKDKIVYEWKGKYDNLLEKSSYELTDADANQKQTEKLNDKIKKQKAEMDRKDATIEMLKSRVKANEDGTREFEQDVKEKQLGLTKDLHALNKKTES